MKLKRIVANFSAAEPEAVGSFYRNIPGLALAMDYWVDSALSRACHVDDERSFSGIVRSFQ